MAPPTVLAPLLWLVAFGLNIPGSFSASIESCPGYKASNVQTITGKIMADLTLAGDACNVYGTDLNASSTVCRISVE
jgi:alpha-glucosidase